MPTKVWIETPLDQEIASVPDEGYAPFYFGPEASLLLFRFNADTFLKVLSALMNGAALTYPDEYLQVVWYFLENVEFPVEFCAQMIACFETDPDVQQAIAALIASNEYVQQALRDFIASDPDIRNTIAGIGNKGTPITNPTNPIIETDDLPALFGAVTYLVDTMNGANEDLYQALEASTNKRELGQILFEAIPVLETLPFDEASEYIDALAEDVAEGYAAQYTTTPITGMRDRLRCGLFCLARANDNMLSWDLIANYFWGEVGFTVADYVDTFVDYVNFFLSGSWTGDEIVLISFGNIASVLSTSQIFSEMTFPSLASIMALGQNDPDPDWETLCEDCPPDEGGLWAIQAGYAGLSEAQSGQITAQTGSSVSFSTDEASGGEYRIIAQYNSYGAPVTIVTSSNPGSILAKYHGVGASLFGGTFTNSQLVADDTLNYLYFTHTAPFTLTLTFTA